MLYNLLVTGGTFDHFHKGHQEFLRFAFSTSEKVLIGLTTDAYAHERKTSEHIESYKIREQSIKNAFGKELAEKRLEIAPISSLFIPDIWKELPIQAILVTQDTYPGGQMINTKRREAHLPPLAIISFPLIPADDSFSLSSTRIRNGTINREGKLYVNEVFSKNTSLLPDRLRALLQRPFGPIKQFQDIDFTDILMSNSITVGDVTSKIFLTNMYYPKVAIVDFFVERERKYTAMRQLGFKGTETVYTASNPAGQLTPALFLTLQKIFAENKEHSILLVDGEEDLTVLTVLLYAPLHFHIFYGQPHEGMVHIVVTEKVKEEAREIIAKFFHAKNSNAH